MNYQLPMTTETRMHCYAYIAYPLAILESSKYVNDYLAKFTLKDEEAYSFTTNHILQEKKEDAIYLSAEKYEQSMQCKFYKGFANDSVIDCELQYLQYTDPWTVFGIFLCDAKDLHFQDIEDQNGYFIGFAQDWGFIEVVDKRVVKLNIAPVSEPVRYHLTVKDQTIEIAISTASNLLYKKQLEFKNNPYAGIYFNFFENRFYNWYYMNFLQISFHESLLTAGGLPVELMAVPRKGPLYYLANPLLDFYTAPYPVIMDHHGDMIHFCIANLKHQNYIELLLDEYYISNRDAFHKVHYFHVNLIYGVDTHAKFFYMLGYTGGKLAVGSTGYADFMQASTAGEDATTTCLKYKTDYYPVEFHIGIVKRCLREFLESSDPTELYASFQANRMRRYGISIFDTILVQQNFEIFLKDIRISYVIYEFNQHIYDLLDFLLARKYIRPEEHQALNGIFKQIVFKCNAVINLVLKYQIRATPKNAKRITELLLEVKELDLRGIALLGEVLH